MRRRRPAYLDRLIAVLYTLDWTSSLVAQQYATGRRWL